MFIHSTKKMRDHLKVRSETMTEQVEEEALFSWHANVVRMNRRQSVVFMHDKSQYTIVLYGVRAKDFSRMGSLFAQAIRMVWREEGIKDHVIEDYLAQSGEVQFTKTKNRSLVARLSRICREVTIYEDEINTEQLIQPDVSVRASRLLAGNGSGDYIYPNEVLYEELRQFSGTEIFSVKAVEMHVRLLLEEKEVWRRLMVPLNRTFPRLHDILQVAFNWWDHHLHEFFVFADQKTDVPLNRNHPGIKADGTKAVVHLVDNEEAFAYSEEIPKKMETGIRLSDYLPEMKRMIYVYDFGDDWRHQIDVTDVVDNYSYNHPVCLDGEGDAPPEDVGGEGGYLEFLRIMDDPDHPDYDHMKQWAKSQLHMPFDLEGVNHMLKRR
ncbi:plasmid pRiA4b ORF-3 family protein [Lentibacillus cibarius]|uniref:Plasmid pRiA4b ORF-3 family protein n=1 Tax=Lentibacillus cibarius TaxID=2583219 RepID=A0A5S3QIE9_9BACI|nr:plasmid pRiA4b ORF-3 family protein [Lentibacillus cibarius]TMN21694.1 plasmid pRiA4b ORF-3 family protein [Lentibacillus cibarius]